MYTHESLHGYGVIVFCDDGVTGTHFDRPKFYELIEMARNQEIQTRVLPARLPRSRVYRAAKRQLDKLGAPKQHSKRKEVVAEIQSLVSQKNECYNDYREKSDRLHELMTMQRNYQMVMQPQQPKHGRKHEQEL